jgi:AcrR family transcriptional regulator
MPAEERRAERRRRLLDAAFDLLGTGGWSATTVRSVCTTAELNPRYFYESFAGLDDLVVAVYDRVVEDLWTAVRTATAREPAARPGDELRTAIDAIVRFIDDDARRGRVLYVEALGSEALNRRRIDAGYALVEVLERDARARNGRLARNEHIGRTGAAILVGGLSELLVARLEGRIRVSRRRLVDDAVALFEAMGEAAATIAQSRARGMRERAT